MKMNFAVFICTHGRPDKQYTYETFRRSGYTGEVHFVVDDEDITVDRLHENYPNDNIAMFHKQYYIDTVDIGRSDAKRAAILYAKCFCEDMAIKLGLDTFVIADDDITNLRYRYDDEGHLRSTQVTKNLDKIFEYYSEYIIRGDIQMTSFGAVQLYIGGKLSEQRLCDSRIPYNVLFRNAHIPFSWISEMNEDTASVLSDRSGKFMQMLPFIKYDMKELMAGAEGGMTASYNQTTTFQRIGTLIMYAPTAVYFIARPLNITHAIHKDNAFPKLISSSFKKL